MAWIEKRGEKRYRVVWDVGAPDERQRRMESFDSWEEADKFRKKVDYESSLGMAFDPSRMTVAEYLDHWLNLHGDNLAPKTLASYQCEIKNHIKPQLGVVKLVKLSPMHLQNYYDHLKKAGKIDILSRDISKLQADYEKALSAGGESRKIKSNLERAKKRRDKMLTDSSGGLSATTIRYHQRIIHKALKQAVKWKMVNYNVADAVEPPKAVKKEIDYLRKEQVHKFINCIKSSPEYPIIITAVFTGMRQGEILGLRWQDVDLHAGIINVRQQLQYIPARGYYFKEPKKESMREIPMPLPLNAVLRRVMKDQQAIKDIYDEAAKNAVDTGDQEQADPAAEPAQNQYQDHDLVFCNYNGSPMDGTGVTKRFQKLLEQHGFPRIRFHALRHTFATMCRAAGMGLADIQDLLGHADISTTKKMYTHIELEPLRKAMDKLTEYMEIDS